jgi:predicted dehydrogenase
MVKVGIIGLGGMGNMHLGMYQASKDAEVVAIADVDPAKLKPGDSTLEINIGAGGGRIDPAKMKLYSKPDDLLKDPNVELVDITLPTFLHAEYMIKALKAGKHVLCEKPMAMNHDECRRVLKAHDASNVKLMIAQCIRFWPEYVHLQEAIDSGRLGRLLSLSLWRGGALPQWSWDQWLQDHKRSGGAILDLHVHDVDYVNYVLGMPKAVCSTGAMGGTGGYDAVDTVYIYEDGKMSIHGGANMILPTGFGFEMKYAASFQDGCIWYSSSRTPSLTEVRGKEVTHPQVPATTGYAEEIAYMLRCVAEDEEPAACPPESSAETIRLAMAEIESVREGKLVEL